MYIESRGYLPKPLPASEVQKIRGILNPTREVTYESQWGEFGHGSWLDNEGIFNLSIAEKIHQLPPYYEGQYIGPSVERKREGEKSFWAEKALEWLPRRMFPMEIMPGVGVAIYRAQDPNHEPVEVILAREMHYFNVNFSSGFRVDPEGFIPHKSVRYGDDPSASISNRPRYEVGSDFLTYHQFIKELHQGEQSHYWMHFNAAYNPVIRIVDPQMVGKDVEVVSLDTGRRHWEELNIDFVVLDASNLRLVEREVVYPFLDEESYRKSLEEANLAPGFIERMHWQTQKKLIESLKKLLSLR